eukprot:TRINITY_DN2765_c0_g1_i1.p1 TRINITY_DN2765_c0_g1~~TRINITY_DN2765_c0_g1_i1.p1  ORF type:complete len:289 (-),score=31.99 TRINITY_DN2765_c0_g1_i1:233-1099(-)
MLRTICRGYRHQQSFVSAQLDQTLPGSCYSYWQGFPSGRQYCAPGNGNSEDTKPPTKSVQDTDLNEKQKQFIENLKQIRGQSGSQVVQIPALQGVLKQLNDLWLQFARYRSTGLGISIKRNLETSFDTEEFTQGALDSYWTIMQLWNDADWETMKSMCGSKVVDVFKNIYNNYEDNGLSCTVTVDEFDDVYIVGMDFLRRQQIIQRFLPELAEENQAEPASNQDEMWLLLMTRIRTKTTTKVARLDGGQILLEQSEQRGDTLWFARGPIPKQLPTDQLDCPWMLIHLT